MLRISRFFIATNILIIFGLVIPPGLSHLAEGKGRKRNKSKNRRKSSKHRNKSHGKKVWNHTPELMKFIKKIKNPVKGQDAMCVARLRAYGIKFQLLTGVKGVNTPIHPYTNKFGGVVYRRAWNNKKAPWILNCKMVENLIIVGKYLKRAGIASLYWTSAWRYSLVHGKKVLSRHSVGEALDITAIDGSFGYASVVNNWTSGCSGCGRGCASRKSGALHAFVCAIKGHGIFRTVYTPQYNARHKDHFHFDTPSKKFKLKVKISKRDLRRPTGVPVKAIKISNNKSTRNQWQTKPAEREWEIPLSRPLHW